MSASRPSSLDTREQVDIDLAAVAVEAIQGGDKGHRLRVAEALMAARLGRIRQDGRRMRDCSTTVLLQGSAASAARIVPNRCDSRFCSLCNAHRHRKSRDRFQRIVELKDTMGDGRLRFITLTQRVFPSESCRDALDRMKREWGRFRRSKLWKDHVVGCVVTFELTWSSKLEGWHAHAHLVASGSYFDQRELANGWPGGDIVDVRAVTEGTERELFKYSVKTSNLDGAQIEEAAEALFRQKLTRFYGAYLKVRPVDVVDLADATEDDRMAVSYIARLDHIAEPGELVFYTWKRLTWVARTDPAAPPHVRSFAWKVIGELLADLAAKNGRLKARAGQRRI